MRKKLFVVLFVVISLIVVISCDNEIELYKVTFDSQGGSTVAPVEVAKDMKVAEPTPPTKAGYTFNGWFKEAELTEQWSFAGDKVTKALTLYAKWTPNNDTAYTVEHYQQDVSGDGYTKIDTENLSGTTGALATAVAKDVTGFSENTTHSDRVATGTILADGLLVLKLYYDRDTYAVTFNTDNGSVVESMTGVRYGATITEPTAPTKTGYTFGGWYKEGLETAWTFASDTVTEAITLYAKWTPNTDTAYKVEHYQQNANDDDYALKETENLTGTTGDSASATAKVYTEFTQNTAHPSHKANGEIAADGSLVLKLYYDRETYEVTFNSNDGSAVTPISARYDASISAPSAPTKIWHNFDGWYKDAELAQQWDFEIDTVTKDITLYAKWEKTYDIGDTGPGGGYVYYDRTEDTTWNGEGWRYLEAAPASWNGSSGDPQISFGYHRDSPDGSNTSVGGTSIEIGSGKANTDALVAAMGDEAYSKLSGGDKVLYAAKIAKDYTGGGLDDWFLPSLDELVLMYANLHYIADEYGFGDISYWSSSEENENSVYCQYFDDEPLDLYPRSSSRNQDLLIRPARAF